MRRQHDRGAPHHDDRLLDVTEFDFFPDDGTTDPSSPYVTLVAELGGEGDAVTQDRAPSEHPCACVRRSPARAV